MTFTAVQVYVWWSKNNVQKVQEGHMTNGRVGREIMENVGWKMASRMEDWRQLTKN